MKFTISARNEQGQDGLLTLIRRGFAMEYWSFEVRPVVQDRVPTQLVLDLPNGPPLPNP